ncbi:hypothetical protein LW377_004528, partial [Salmonella enterica]|nr:hypothetical protein [Salmonella enterica]
MSYSDTPEQADVIAWQGKRLVVGAFAGTGKTTTLRRFAEQNPDERMTSAIVLSQRCRVVLVGDRHQQIYRFRGADNAMDTPQLEHADRLWLTNSFRFGPEVANVANRLLALKGETHKVIGKGPQDRVVDMLPRTCGHRAVLHRTVCGVISTAL